MYSSDPCIVEELNAEIKICFKRSANKELPQIREFAVNVWKYYWLRRDDILHMSVGEMYPLATSGLSV